MGTYSNRLGTDIGEEFHSWGFEFWDSIRMERVDAKTVLKLQCIPSCWGRGDPRTRLAHDGYAFSEVDGDDWVPLGH